MVGRRNIADDTEVLYRTGARGDGLSALSVSTEVRAVLCESCHFNERNLRKTLDSHRSRIRLITAGWRPLAPHPKESAMTNEASTVTTWKMTGTRLGNFLEHRGRLEAALSIYRLSASTPPTAGDSFAIGNCLYRLEKYSEALPFLRVAAFGSRATEQQINRYLNAVDYLGNYADEIGTLDESSSLRLKISKRYARHLERSGNIEDALAVYLTVDLTDDSDVLDKIDELTPDSAPVWQRIERHNATADTHRHDPEWLRKRGNLLFEAHKYREAGETFSHLLAVDDSSSWDAYCAGISLEIAGSPEYQQYYDLARRRDDSRNAQKFGIGVFHEEAIRFKRAGQAYRTEAEMTHSPSTRAELFRRSAMTFQGAFDLQEAESSILRAIALRPRRPELHALLSLNFYLLGQFSNAAMSASRAQQLGDTSDEVRNLHFLSCYSTRDFNGAVALFTDGSVEEQTDVIEPELHGNDSEPIEVPEDLPDIEAHRQWSQVLLDAGYTETSADVLVAGMERYQAHFEPSDARKAAHALMKAGRAEEAARVIHQSLRHTDPIPKVYGNPKVPGLGTIFMYRSWLAAEPIRPNDILFESNLGLSVDCNPLAIYRHIRDNEEGKFTLYWSVDKDAVVPPDVWQDPNTIIVRKNSSRYVKLLASAGYLVNNSTFPTYFVRRPEQQYLMTWHGTPFKTLGRDQPELLGHANMTRNLLQASIVVHPNSHTRRVLMETCDVADLTTARSVITGYPRNDALRSHAAISSTRRVRPLALYAPTWKSDAELADQASSIVKVAKILEAHGYEVVVRAHHYVESKLGELAPDVSTVQRVIPTNDLLPEVDVLITDYSSIYFDFSVLRRPIIFYVPDWDDYTTTRGAYFEEDELPGRVCRTTSSFEEAIVTLSSSSDAIQPTEAFVKEFAPMDDGQASARATDLLLRGDHTNNTPSPDPTKKNLLFRQSFIPNGMTSSFINLARSLSRTRYRPFVLTDAASAQSDEARGEMVKSLPRDVGVIGRIGRHSVSRKEHLALLAITGDPSAISDEARNIRRESFTFEASRVTGNARFDKVIEYDGYSSFMANVVLGHASRTQVTGILLHSDLQREAILRFPEIYRIVDQIAEFDRVAAVSPSLAAINVQGLAALGVETPKIGHARNIVDIESMSQRAAAPAAPDLSEFVEDSQRLIVFLGRLSPEKNLADTVRAFSKVRADRSDVRLLIIGDGPEREKLRTLAGAILPANSYFFAGHRDNPFPYLAAADMLVMSSFHEGQPMVILEALALHTPTVAMNIPSLSEFENLTGVVVSDFNSDSLAMKISSVLSNPPVVEFDPQTYVESALIEFDIAFEKQ